MESKNKKTKAELVEHLTNLTMNVFGLAAIVSEYDVDKHIVTLLEEYPKDTEFFNSEIIERHLKTVAFKQLGCLSDEAIEFFDFDGYLKRLRELSIESGDLVELYLFGEVWYVLKIKT